MRICVVGLGKLGAPLAAILADRGHDVTGVDARPEVVELLNEGRTAIQEPGLAELIERNRSRLRATTDLAAAAADTDASFIVVPTPSDCQRHVLDALRHRCDRGHRTRASSIEELPRRDCDEHGDASVARSRDQARARGGVRPHRRRNRWTLLQPGIHCARERHPRHDAPRSRAHRRVGSARRRRRGSGAPHRSSHSTSRCAG